MQLLGLPLPWVLLNVYVKVEQGVLISSKQFLGFQVSRAFGDLGGSGYVKFIWVVLQIPRVLVS